MTEEYDVLKCGGNDTEIMVSGLKVYGFSFETFFQIISSKID